jgi:hypothetical protein
MPIKTTLAGRELFVEAKKILGVSLDLCGKQNIQLSMEKMLDKPIWHGAYSQALPAMRQRQTLVFQI